MFIIYWLPYEMRYIKHIYSYNIKRHLEIIKTYFGFHH